LAAGLVSDMDRNLAKLARIRNHMIISNPWSQIFQNTGIKDIRKLQLQGLVQ
jgi:hypothetical protein